MATIEITGELRLDESGGFQDSDVDLGTLPTEFSTKLFTDLGLSSALAAEIGVGESPDNFITVQGASGDPELTFSITDGTDSNLNTLDGEDIYLFADTTNPNIVYGIDTADGSGDVIFALYLEPAADGLSAKVWSVLIEPLAHGDPTDPDDEVTLQGLSVSVDSEVSFPFDNVASGNFYYVMIGDPQAAVLISSSDPDNLTTNTSQGGIGATVGVASQMTGPGEELVLTYVSGADSAFLNSPSNAKKKWGEEADIADALPGGAGTLEGTGGSISISQGQGSEPSSLVLSAFDTDLETGSAGGADDYSDGLGDDAPVTITGVTVVEASGGAVTASASDNGDGTWTVTGLEAGDVIQYTTAGDHNRIKVAHDDSDPNADAPFDIGGVSLNQSTSDSFGVTDIYFDDDGPTEGPFADPAMMVLDESPVPPNGDGVTSVAQSFFGLDPASLVDFGTDGEGTVSHALVLSTDGVGSGLYALDATDTDGGDGDGIGQGDEITLSQSGDTITGSAGGTDYFTISVDPVTGVVTFTQLANVWHANIADSDDASTLSTPSGTLTIVQTVTDTEGDFVTDTRDLSDGVFKIEDDGPTAAADPLTNDDTATVDESPVPPDGDGVVSDSFDVSDNFAAGADFGTDGPGSQSYALELSGANAASGLFALDGNGGPGQGEAIVLNMDGDDIVGTSEGGSVEHFRISVDGNGVVTFSQSENVWHGDDTNPDDSVSLEAAAGTIQVRQTVMDADGDTASATLDLSSGIFSIEDDGPSIGAIADGQVAFSQGETASDSGFLDYGTDGAGDFVFTSFEAAPDDTVLGEMTETLSADGKTVTYTSANNGDVFEVSLDSAGGYTFEVLQDAPLVLNTLDFASVSPGGPKEAEVITGEGSTVTTFDGFLFDHTTFDQQAKPTITLDDGVDGTADDVNISTPGVGLDDNQMDIDEGLELSFSDGVGGDEDVEGVQLLIQGGTGKNAPFDIRFIAYDDDVEVNDSTFTDVPMPNGNDELLFDYLPEISFDTLEIFIDFDNPKGGLRIKEVSLFEREDIPDFSFDFEVAASDADGDMTTGMFTVGVDSNDDGIIT